jgi:hypothetical protein
VHSDLATSSFGEAASAIQNAIQNTIDMPSD